jgi:hypothetical protein
VVVLVTVGRRNANVVHLVRKVLVTVGRSMTRANGYELQMDRVLEVQTSSPAAQNYHRTPALDPCSEPQVPAGHLAVVCFSSRNLIHLFL